MFREYYFTAVSWISLTEVSVVWLNRPQNLSLVSVCKTPMWHCQEVSNEILGILGFNIQANKSKY